MSLVFSLWKEDCTSVAASLAETSGIQPGQVQHEVCRHLWLEDDGRCSRNYASHSISSYIPFDLKSENLQQLKVLFRRPWPRRVVFRRPFPVPWLAVSS